jgi:hypothetical protein
MYIAPGSTGKMQAVLCLALTVGYLLHEGINREIPEKSSKKRAGL